MPSEHTDTEPIQVRFHRPLLAEMRGIAKAEGMATTELIRYVMRAYVEERGLLKRQRDQDAGCGGWTGE